MKGFDVTRLTAMMDILVLERTPEDGFSVYGTAPEWLPEFEKFVIPGSGDLDVFSTFMSAFLDKLGDFWSRENEGPEKAVSEWWTKISKHGPTHYFQATALRFPETGFLIVSHATSESELFRSLQKYKVGMLALEKIRGDYKTCRTELSHFREMSVTDSLSGLFNQTGFFDKTQKLVQEAETHKKKLLVLSVGLDGLFQVNDSFGISEGTRAIRTLGGLLKNFFPRTDVIARFGGGEYVVLAEETALNSEETVIPRLHQYVADYNESSPKKYDISVSAGVVRFPEDGKTSLEELVQTAGICMNEEKQSKAHNLMKPPSK